MASDDKLREYLKRVTVDLHDTRERLREVEERSREPVAILGMACRYPGGIRSPRQLWELVERGEDAISDFPPDRGWDLERLYHPDPEHRGTCYAREGGFIYDVGEFDASFFGISPREALAMDPKQRMLLETSWEALEDGDIDPLSLRGSKTGVFTGVSDQDYATMLLKAPSVPRDLEGYIGLGAALSVASGRVAYSLGLEGPAVTVDTACSSSLVALHLACAALRSGECALALVGGAAVMSTPGLFVEFSRQRGLAPDGRCKSFADAADGAGWGEGAGVLLVELLCDAQRHGHRVLGIVRGSAVNQDGASNGLTAPNGPSQQRVIRQALANAALSEMQVDLVEAHGTGTTLGDPIEAQALIATYGANREPEKPLRLGSIKSNIGHTMAAAGIAGVIKAVMAMRHQVLPKTLHIDAPSSNVDWSAGSVSLLCDAMPWERNGEPRRVGVSSFGMSGTNAHVILEEAPLLDSSVDGPEDLDGGADVPEDLDSSADATQDLGGGVVGGDPLPWVLSARSESALCDQAARLRALVSDDESLGVREIASPLMRRAQLEHRAVVVGASREEMIAGLDTLANGTAGANAIAGMAGRPGAVFLFSGQGAQWAGMAHALLDCSPVFGERIRECEQALAPVIDWKLEDVLREVDGAPGLDRNDVVQPVLFSVMVSLAALWRACGVHPTAVIGHSQGEIAAACVAGGLSLEDAARIVALRSRMQLALEGHGAMMSIAAPQAQVRQLLEMCGGRIGVAAVNSPSSMVLTGEREALSELVEVCEAQGIRTRMIRGGKGASHSPQVEPLREELLQALRSIAPRTGAIPFCSTVTGGLLDTGELGAEYWYRNMREPVLFEPALRGLLEAGHRTLIEVSAHPVLAIAMQETIEQLVGEIEGLADEPASAIGSLRRDQGGPARFLTSLGEAWTRGVAVDWRAVRGVAPARRVSLPTYAFQRERYWFEMPTGEVGAALSIDPGGDADTKFDAVSETGAEASADSAHTADSQLGDLSKTGVTHESAGENGAHGAKEDALAARLAPLDKAGRERVALELVLSQAAGVLGYATPDRVNPRKTFRDLGFDSLMAVDLRNRLQSATGLRLDSTLVFSQPTPAALARYLVAQATGAADDATASISIAARNDGPIAIVGMSCRYPGGVRSPQELWDLVASGGDAIGDFPTDRGWDLEQLYDPDPDHRGTSYVREGGFLYDAADFDAGFFGIGRYEALAMDPQQRLLLEACWEAFEYAGLDPEELRGSQTAVYVGCAGQDYSTSLFNAAAGELEGYRAAGGMASMVSGRVSYLLGLEGAAVSVDTACSSSLVALHLACQALRAGECSLALAGGVTVMSSPVGFIEASRLRAFARDARCKAFADSADGTSFSEGVGMLALERLSDAQRLDHQVLAVIRGSAVNQDGASNGLTAPNGASQERVIRQALANAGLSPEEVDAVEAHGTGTMLGDPIEAHALLATYGRARADGKPLWLGSIKSNIGHTSAAAGVAGVIKTTMALRNELLPRTLHVDQPSRQVDWSTGAVSLLAEERAWKRNGRPRRAGVSSFGASGTNVHLIVEESPSEQPASGHDASAEALGGDSVTGGVHAGALEDDSMPGLTTDVAPLGDVVAWVLSGKGEPALRGQADSLAAYLYEVSRADARDVGSSLVDRPAFESRAVVLGSSADGLRKRLGALASGEPAADLVRGVAKRSGGPVVFLFPGQGAQWQGMALELLERSPVFAARMRSCADALAPFVDWSLEDVLRGVQGAPELERLDVVQPALFAVMVSLAELWRACGVAPDVVVGHSQGEIAAACVSGGLSLEDASRIVAVRSRMLMALEGRGAMMSIAASQTRVREMLERWDGRIVVAAVNGPSSLVLAGENEALSELVAASDEQGIRTRMIRGGGRASHSPQVQELRDELLDALGSITPRAGDIRFCSTVTGELLDTEQLDAEYWYRNMREPVQFEPALRGLLERGHRTFVEISAHQVLAVAVQETIAAHAAEVERLVEAPACVVGSLRRDQGGPARFVASLAEAWVCGTDVNWRAVLGPAPTRRVRLPTYAFQRRRYWVQPRHDLVSAEHAGLDLGETWEPTAYGELARRLTTAPEDERRDVALAFILGEVAAVLGRDSSDEIDPGRAFLELGFESLTALELRNRLGSATGLSLPNALALDYPTPEALAGYLAGRSAEMKGDRDGGQEIAQVATNGQPTGMLTELFREAHELEKLGEFTELLMGTSRFRATFDGSAHEVIPAPVRLSEGATHPDLVCLPSAVAMSGPHEYARFARAFRGNRKVSVLPIPGYVSGERLPASFEVMVSAQAEAVRRYADGSPFAIVGYSSGGILAHAVARYLESVEVFPMAVVLIDTYRIDIEALSKLAGIALAGVDAYPFINDVRITAMGAYLKLLAEWTPTEIATPLLLAKAAEPIPGIPIGHQWRSKWEFTHTDIEIPGHHFTIMGEHADATARTVQEWLSATFDKCYE